MIIIKAEEARRTVNEIVEAKKLKEKVKLLDFKEQEKLHNIFNNVNKAANQGDKSLIVDTSTLTDNMLEMISFLGYKIKGNEMFW